MSEKPYGFETLTLHAGQEPDPTTLARAVSRVPQQFIRFPGYGARRQSFCLEGSGQYLHPPHGNPTQDVLEKRMAALEGGSAALALASGTSAIFYAMINILETGNEIVSANNLYGGTFTMFNNILPQFGIKTRFVDPTRPEDFDNAINDKTRAIFIETIGNPVLGVTDIEAVAGIARKNHLPLVVDSTFTTPYLLRPLEHGADIVVHSLTKWLGGHGTAIGGIVIDSGKFDWTDPKFTLYNQPDESYHNLRYAHDLGDLNHLAFILRMRLVPLRNLGACISPDNAWMFLQGIETLPLRMERHCENALRVAEHLEKHPQVAWVHYPGLPKDPTYPTAAKYLKKGFGGMVVFGTKGGYEAGKGFINRLQLFSHLANVGDAKSLAIHPASTTHSQLTEAEQKAGGIAPEMIRLSIGIETSEDLIADIDQALEG